MFLGHGQGRFEREDLEVSLGQGRLQLLVVALEVFELVDLVGGLDAHDLVGVLVGAEGFEPSRDGVRSADVEASAGLGDGEVAAFDLAHDVEFEGVRVAFDDALVHRFRAVG